MKTFLTAVLLLLGSLAFSQDVTINKTVDVYTKTATFRSESIGGVSFIKDEKGITSVWLEIEKDDLFDNVEGVYILFENGKVYHTETSILSSVHDTKFAYFTLITFQKGDELYNLLSTSKIVSFKLGVFDTKVEYRKNETTVPYTDAIINAQ